MKPEREKFLKSFIAKYERRFKASLVMELAGIVPRGAIPDLVFALDEDCYTNGSLIHIGVDQSFAKDEKELFYFVEFLIGHEIAHCLHTPNRPWVAAVSNGAAAVVKEAGKRYGYKVPTLLTAENARKALARMNRDGHKVPSWQAVVKFVHGICNILEDGRIERARSGEYPGFAKYCRIYNGRIWAEKVAKKPSSATEAISLYANEILSLAVCHSFSKGFTSLVGTDWYNKVVYELIPPIRAAIRAPKCKECMKEAVKICEILAPTFMDAVAESPDPSEIPEWLKAFIRQLASEIQSISDARRENAERECTEDGESACGFGNDLDISGEKTEEAKPSDGTGDNPDDIEGSPENGAKAKDPEGKGRSLSDGENGEKAKLDPDGNQSGEKSTDESDPADSENGTPAGEHAGKDETSPAKSEEEILQAMREAAEAANEDYSYSGGNSWETFSGIDSDATNIPEEGEPVTFDSLSELLPAESAPEFKEFFREYTVDEPLPDALIPAAKELREKARKFFRGKNRSRKRSGYTSGDIDDGNLWKLCVGEPDPFSRTQKPDKFSGCAYILQDNSGSMGYGQGSKRQYASEACSLIEYAFKKYIPLKIVAFDENGEIYHEVVKNWNEDFSNSCSISFFQHGRDGGGNSDYWDISIASEELLRRKERNKILIVLSDGAPWGSIAGKSAETLVSESVASARARGITVVGIYISNRVTESERSGYVKMYGESCVFTDTEHIAEELSSVMERVVFR